jgi:hypothetical protein
VLLSAEHDEVYIQPICGPADLDPRYPTRNLNLNSGGFPEARVGLQPATEPGYIGMILAGVESDARLAGSRDRRREGFHPDH